MFKYRETSGNHLVVDITQIRSKFDFDKVRNLMAFTCRKYGFTVCNTVSKTFGTDRRAFSILYLLSESHMSVHTYPERDAIAMDIYTCSPKHTREVLEEIADMWRECFNGGGTYQILARKL
jgi:S-adenosylmethionine decarboxylase